MLSLRWCVVKIKVLNMMLAWMTPKKSMELVPFVSCNVYMTMVKKLDLIDSALKEVSHLSMDV